MLKVKINPLFLLYFKIKSYLCKIFEQTIEGKILHK